MSRPMSTTFSSKLYTTVDFRERYIQNVDPNILFSTLCTCLMHMHTYMKYYIFKHTHYYIDRFVS